MRTNPWPWVAIAALTLAAGALLGWQRRLATELRAELDARHAQAREQARLQAEHRRLAATQPTPAEVDALLAERTAVAHLRTELDALRRRAQESVAVRRTEKPAQAQPSLPLTGNVLAFHQWKNLGRATPEAAMETALWASAGGDIDTLTGLLDFDPEAQGQAAALFAGLPETLRREFVSPERLIAVLAAKDVPLGSATILNLFPSPTETRVATQIFDAEGRQKVALLSLRPDDAGWRFVVPVNAVKRYAAWLHAPAATAATVPAQP